MAEIGDEDQAGWDEACRREAAIRDLLSRHPKRLRISMVEAVAQELGVSRATLYRLIARYRQTRTVEGLRGPGSGRSEGTRVLNSDVETLIRDIGIANPRFYEEHLRKLRSWYSQAPFLATTLSVLEGVYSKGHAGLAELTSKLTIAIAEYMGITCTFRFARGFDIQGDRASMFEASQSLLMEMTYKE